MRIRYVLEADKSVFGPGASKRARRQLRESAKALGIQLSNEIDVTWTTTDPDGNGVGHVEHRWVVASADVVSKAP